MMWPSESRYVVHRAEEQQRHTCQGGTKHTVTVQVTQVPTGMLQPGRSALSVPSMYYLPIIMLPVPEPLKSTVYKGLEVAIRIVQHHQD